jgi:hypothetical protein
MSDVSSYLRRKIMVCASDTQTSRPGRYDWSLLQGHGAATNAVHIGRPVVLAIAHNL